MGRLILIRHGESEGNAERVFTRHAGVPLTARGRAQALAAGRRIQAAFRPAQLVTSPFARARETAGILADALGLSVEVEPDLRERSYGAMAGQPYDAGLAGGEGDPLGFWYWSPPGGESLAHVAARAGAALDRIAAGAAADGDVVVVSHGGVMFALWWHVTGSWSTDGVVPNAGIVVVERDAAGYAGARALDER